MHTSARCVYRPWRAPRRRHRARARRRSSGAETLCLRRRPGRGRAATARALATDTARRRSSTSASPARATLEPGGARDRLRGVYCDLVDATRSFPRVERAAPDPRPPRSGPRGRSRTRASCRSGRARASAAARACAEVEAMEGFAVLRAAALAGVPALELRAVSNRYDDAARRTGGSTRRSSALAERRPAAARGAPMRDLPPPLPPAERTVGQLDRRDDPRLRRTSFWRLLPLGLPLAVVDQLCASTHGASTQIADLLGGRAVRRRARTSTPARSSSTSVRRPGRVPRSAS